MIENTSLIYWLKNQYFGGVFLLPRISKKSKSINDIIVGYLEYCNYKNLSLKTIKSYHQTLMLFSKYLEEEKQITDINKINKDTVEEYISFTKERGKYSFVASEGGMIKANIDKRSDIGKEVSNCTLNNYLRNIKAFFSYLVDNQIIKSSNVHQCKFIKTERISKEQLRRTILIPAYLTKGRKDRVVFYSMQMAKLLQRWLKFKDTMQETELLFPTQRTNTIISNPNFERSFPGY